jgi:membrane protein implicated in regulation of membrane protease activity
MAETHFFWWILALVMVVLELLTGTFYLLVLAFGCAGGAIAAMLGAGVSIQFLVSALVCLLGWAFLRKRQRSDLQQRPEPQADSAVNLDIGELILVSSWDELGASTVDYRGAKWQSELAPGLQVDGMTAGAYKIVKIVGNRLILRPVNSSG